MRNGQGTINTGSQEEHSGKVKQELPYKAFLTRKQINRRTIGRELRTQTDGVDEEQQQESVSTAVTVVEEGDPVSDIGRSSRVEAGPETKEQDEVDRMLNDPGNQSNGLVGDPEIN